MHGDGAGKCEMRPADWQARLAGTDRNFSFFFNGFSTFRDMNCQQPASRFGIDLFVVDSVRQFDRPFKAAIMALGKHEAFTLFPMTFRFLPGDPQHAVGQLYFDIVTAHAGDFGNQFIFIFLATQFHDRAGDVLEFLHPPGTEGVARRVVEHPVKLVAQSRQGGEYVAGFTLNQWCSLSKNTYQVHPLHLPEQRQTSCHCSEYFALADSRIVDGSEISLQLRLAMGGSSIFSCAPQVQEALSPITKGRPVSDPLI